MSTAIAIRQEETLWHIEEELDSLLNSVDLCETPEQEQECRALIADTVQKAVAKRDSVAAWLAREESTIAAIEAEIVRLRALKDRRERNISRVEEYVISVMLALGPDSKGRLPKLQGVTSCLGTRKNPPSVEIVDPEMLPEDYLSFDLSFDPQAWREFTDSLPSELLDKLMSTARVKTSPCKSAIKKALEHGEEVSGAQIAPVKYRLVRE